MKKIPVDITALIARIAIGVIFIAHGWQKWQNGTDATTQMFTQYGVPQPQLAATATMIAELAGGALLILGLFVRVAALVLLAVTVGAIIFVHGRHGIYIADNGWELVGALGAASLLLMGTGGGRIGLDGIFLGLHRRTKARQEAEEQLAVTRQARDEAERKVAEARSEVQQAEAARAAAASEAASAKLDERAAAVRAEEADREDGRFHESVRVLKDYPGEKSAGTQAAGSGTPPQRETPEPPRPQQDAPQQDTPRPQQDAQGLGSSQQGNGLSEQDHRDIDELLSDEDRRPGGSP